ncbi:hypothetical protein FOHLNKBM_0501 [Methylobacterium longum]|nr:hypothetical protein FOHLNKBM_0501 [Methylobacterium longum]
MRRCSTTGSRRAGGEEGVADLRDRTLVLVGYIVAQGKSEIITSNSGSVSFS